ncbi:MAG: VanZ family protein [bacterium]
MVKAHLGIYSPRLHVIMYGLLLIATPFILLQKFLIEKISELSQSSFSVYDINIPIILLLGVVTAIIILYSARAYLTWFRSLAILIVILMNCLSQQIADYYFDHNFYDLQQNWHYFAYGIFAFLIYRDLAPRNYSMARIILISYITALCLSLFDEFFQMNMSSRVFDVSDIAKDLWGNLMGIILLYMFVSDPSILSEQWKRIRHRKLKYYLTHSPSLLILMFIFALLLVIFGSLLSEVEYFGYVVLLTLVSFTIFFLLFHLSQFKKVKYIIVGLLLCAIAFQTYFYLKYSSKNIVYNQYGLAVYKGIPIFYFDFLVFPNESFRLVDKKHFFNNRDQNFLKKQKPDIIVISSGNDEKGGWGFPQNTPVQFIYNQYTQSGIEVIILKNSEACELFNRLKEEGKNVLFIYHNTF